MRGECVSDAVLCSVVRVSRVLGGVRGRRHASLASTSYSCVSMMRAATKSRRHYCNHTARITVVGNRGHCGICVFVTIVVIVMIIIIDDDDTRYRNQKEADDACRRVEEDVANGSVFTWRQ